MSVTCARFAALLAVFAAGCHPPATHALTVRDVEGKCALIFFSGCSSLGGESSPTSEGADAELDSDAGPS